jgi:hypothetical protein
MTNVLTRDQILENRKKAIAFLKEPARRKAQRWLDLGYGRRCCLGHMCFALEIEHKQVKVNGRIGYGHMFEDISAPQELVDLLGLWDDNGGNKSCFDVGKLRGQELPNLTCMNDDTEMTPQQIGEYLETVIEGGDDVPFKPLDEFPMEPEDSNLRG